MRSLGFAAVRSLRRHWIRRLGHRLVERREDRDEPYRRILCGHHCRYRGDRYRGQGRNADARSLLHGRESDRRGVGHRAITDENGNTRSDARQHNRPEQAGG
jgi:hypothetical protein